MAGRSALAPWRLSCLSRHDVFHLPDGVPGYAHGRVVLAGDAAHATLPTCG